MNDIINAVGAGSAFAGLAFVSVLFWRLYGELRKDRDYWRNTAMRFLGLADAGAKVAEALVTPPVLAPPAAPQVALDDNERRRRLEMVVDILLKRAETVDDGSH